MDCVTNQCLVEPQTTVNKPTTPIQLIDQPLWSWGEPIFPHLLHTLHMRDHLGWSDQENLSSALVCGKLHVAPTYSFPFPQTGATVYTFGFVFGIVHIPSQVVRNYCIARFQETHCVQCAINTFFELVSTQCAIITWWIPWARELTGGRR